jgi:putative component of toxin-antitoxin plasmid stabilization module
MKEDKENRLKDTLARDKLLERLFKMDLSCGDLEWLAEGIMDEVACRMEE